MLKRLLSLALVCALYVGFVCVKPGLARQQTDVGKPTPPPKDTRQTERIRRDVQNYGVAAKVTVILKDNQERYGEIAEIDADTFQIVEVDMKRLLTFAYKDVKKVRYNYGGPNPFTGKRWHPRWAIISAVAVFAMILIVIPLSIPRT